MNGGFSLTPNDFTEYIKTKEFPLLCVGSAESIEVTPMCRNIRTLFNFEPPVTDDEIRAASLQFVRKVSGFVKPSKANEAAFLSAVEEVAKVSKTLLGSLETNASPRNREEEAAKARARSAVRYRSLS